MAFLIQTVDRLGSINQAAVELKMSYRQAWGDIKKAEERLGFKLLERQVGGEHGGGARLTVEARTFLLRYEQFRADINAAVEKIFNANFNK